MSTGMNSRTGKRLSDRTHIEQSVVDILTTPIGSRIKRREYGSLLPDLVDQPLNGATLLKAYSATVTALIRWEPRLSVTSVAFSSTAAGELVVDLESAETGNSATKISVPLGIKGVT